MCIFTPSHHFIPVLSYFGLMKSFFFLFIALSIFPGCERAKHSSNESSSAPLEKLIISDKNSSLDAKSRFCLERTSSPFDIQKLLSKSENGLWFLTRSGFMQTGLDWWYSRFMRAAAYLAVYDPSLPKPTDQEAKQLIDHIRNRDGVITIPGFSNLIEFSAFYEKQILQKLKTWQHSDDLLKLGWISVLTGTSRVSSDELEQKMNELHERIKRGEVVYQKLQMPGLAVHSWLVISMEPTNDGYELMILDSNKYNPQSYTYSKGMRSFDYEDAYFHTNFVPYTEQTDEEIKLKKHLIKACEKSSTP